MLFSRSTIHAIERLGNCAVIDRKQNCNCCSVCLHDLGVPVSVPELLLLFVARKRVIFNFIFFWGEMDVLLCFFPKNHLTFIYKRKTSTLIRKNVSCQRKSDDYRMIVLVKMTGVTNISI